MKVKGLQGVWEAETCRERDLLDIQFHLSQTAYGGLLLRIFFIKREQQKNALSFCLSNSFLYRENKYVLTFINSGVQGNMRFVVIQICISKLD